MEEEAKLEKEEAEKEKKRAAGLVNAAEQNKKGVHDYSTGDIVNTTVEVTTKRMKNKNLFRSRSLTTPIIESEEEDDLMKSLLRNYHH